MKIGGGQGGSDVQTLWGDEALSALDELWDELASRQEVPNPLMTGTWLRNLAYWERGTPMAILVSSGSMLVAAGIFGVARIGAWPRKRCATWLGTDEQRGSFDVLVRAGFPTAREELFSTLLQEVDAAVLSVPSGQPSEISLARPEWFWWLRPHARGWLLPLPAPRAKYAADKANSDLRRVARLGVDVDIRIARTPDEVLPALERLFVLHRQRWAGVSTEIRRFSSSEEQRDWYRRAVHEMAERDRARIVEVSENGELVAAVLGFIEGGGALTHTPAFRAGGFLKWPGHLSFLSFVNHVADCGATVVDFGWGAGEPGSPKARLGPTEVPIACAYAARDTTAKNLLWMSMKLAGARRRIARLRRVKALRLFVGNEMRNGRHGVAWTRARRILSGGIRSFPGRVRAGRPARALRYVRDAVFDWRRGVKTRGVRRRVKTGVFAHAGRYERTPTHAFRKIMDSLVVDRDRTTFVDVGCGRGGVLMMAAELGFARVIGVELSRELAGEARTNIDRWDRWQRARGGRSDAISIVVADAAHDWQFCDDPCLLYLFNPFFGPTMDDFASRLHHWLSMKPREATIVYYNPEYRAALDKSALVRPVLETRRCVVYQSIKR